VKKIVSLAAGVAVGYVLGSRAGREKYEQIAEAARRYAGSSTAEGPNVDGDAPARSRRTGSASAPRERFTADTVKSADTVESADTAAPASTAESADIAGSAGAGDTVDIPDAVETVEIVEMVDTTDAAVEAELEREELRVAAKELVEDLPGETALGNRDPAAGGHGDPKDYEGR
jgi:hypothetical protein